MADIELVIKIPEELICEMNDENYQDVISWFDKTIYRVLKDSTVLPKGHGRLIDASVFWEMLNNMPVNYEDKWFNWMQKESIRLASVPTIIEADKAESEEA